MLQLALIDNGNGLKAPVRVFVHSARMVGGHELRRAGVVQQQERAKCGPRVSKEKTVRTGNPSPTQCISELRWTRSSFFTALSFVLSTVDSFFMVTP